MKRSGIKLVQIAVMVLFSHIAFADDTADDNIVNAAGNIEKLEDVKVTATKGQNGVVIMPHATTIDIDDYKMAGTPQNITDVLKDNAIIDFRGESNLVPSNDTIFMRGFDTRRFVTAIDGLTIEKSGNGYGNYGVDYAILSLGQIQSIEIMPGPHSALYPGQSIGGVINLVMKTPDKATTLKPDVNIKTSYQSYNTQNHSAGVEGGGGGLVYGLCAEGYHTDGYLRHNETDIRTYSGRLGYILPSDGYISLSTSFTDQDREMAVDNDPDTTDYDPGDPVVTVSAYSEWQDPVMNKESQSFRLKYEQPSSTGTWYLGAYYNEEESERYFSNYIDATDPSLGISRSRSWDVIWSQLGAKLQNEITISENHVTTIGFDEVLAYNESSTLTRHKRLDRKAGYIQHKWRLMPRAKLTLGARYEDVDTWICNLSSRTASGYYNSAVQKDYIDRHFSGFAPKSFFTYELDDVAEILRETSLSVGVSRIWHAPTSGMDMHSNGQPGFYLDEEHGIGYDFIVTRRLWRDVNFKINYAFYEIEDYIAWNHSFAQNIPSRTNSVPSGLEYSDSKINLEKVQRHGVEVEINGSLNDDLTFYANYAFQDFDNKGDELAGKTELDDRAQHRVNAGLRYRMAEDTIMLVDYTHQSKQVAYNANEVAPDEWEFYAVPLDAYHVFDFAIEHMLFKQYGYMTDAVLKIYCNNIFHEEYMNVSGYPMTDQTFGIALRFGI
jgi:outer membrane cobalamin receptor